MSSYTVCDQMCVTVCEEVPMATNLALSPELVDRALTVSGKRTKKAAVTEALEEYVARHEQSSLIELFGTADWSPDYDYKAERSRE